MLSKYPQFIFAFAIVFFADIIAITTHLQELRFATKPLITISLMLFIAFTIKRKGRFTKRILAGLFFSLLGDIFLMFPTADEFYFLMGLGAFLIAHLFYVTYYRKLLNFSPCPAL